MAAQIKLCPGRPKDEALQGRRREEILERAARIFAEHGYPRTDVQWIAQAIGVSKGTVYRYFPTKQELFLAAVDRGVARLHEHIERARRGIEEPFGVIRGAVFAYLQFFKKNPELVELLIQERAEFKGKRKSSYFEHRDARRGPWREMVRGLIAQGRIRRMPVERVIDVLGDVLYGTMFTNHFAGRDKPFEAQAQDILDVVFNGILTQKERSKFD
jgi:AcrR family transcriptional regulator